MTQVYFQLTGKIDGDRNGETFHSLIFDRSQSSNLSFCRHMTHSVLGGKFSKILNCFTRGWDYLILDNRLSAHLLDHSADCRLEAADEI